MIVSKNLNKEILKLADNANSFIEFIHILDDSLLKNFLETRYIQLKEDNNNNPVYLGKYACIEFTCVLLLELFSNVKVNEKTEYACKHVINLTYEGMNAHVFSQLMQFIIKEESSLNYNVWKTAYEYLKNTHSFTIRSLEISKPATEDNIKRFNSYVQSLN
ncbi:MAG: hypothetical protein ACRCX8_01010 [Sarcina sp.]